MINESFLTWIGLCLMATLVACGDANIGSPGGGTRSAAASDSAEPDSGFGMPFEDGPMGGTGGDGAMGGTGGDGAMGGTGDDGAMGGTGDDGAMGGTGGDGPMGGTGDDGAMGGTSGDGAMGGTGDDGGSLGRVAISADGNLHDRDDIGATAVSLAILAQAGLQANLVHYDHCSHIAESNDDQHEDMIASATGRLTEFGFNPAVVFDDMTELSASVANIAKAIDASSASDPLTFIVAGPFEVAWQGINQAMPSRRQYVTLLSHSAWNDNHQHVASEHTKDELLADFPTVKSVMIDDQNANAFKSAPSAWDWMNTAGPDLAWVRTRMEKADYAEGDNSDAGMVFYFVTGNQNATMAQIKAFFGQ